MVQYSMKQDEDNHLVHQSAASKEDDSLTPEEIAYRDQVIPLLLVRAYHLPNNSWKQDWIQYMTNNHPVLGIFWHHRYHPVKRLVRIASLIGSMLFGLALTNIIYLAFVFSNTDYDKSYVEVDTSAAITGNVVVDSAVPALSLTNGNIALWTIGAFLHASYDNLIWSLAACSCCDKGVVTEQKLKRYRSLSVFLVMLSVVVVTALATFAVALRAALSSDDGTQPVDATGAADNGDEFVTKDATLQSYGVSDDNVQLFQVDGANDFEFIIAYLIELVLNFFIYYPVIGTLLFSGVLTGGRYGVWGGRPYELKEENERVEGDDMEQACSRSSHKSHPRD